MDAGFARAQAEYDAMQPPEDDCHHDGDVILFVSDAGTRYLMCRDCFEFIPDPEQEESCATYS